MTSNPQKIRIALDAMGGDRAPSATVEGACRAVREGLPVLLVGDEAVLRPLIPKGLDLPILHAAEAVGMGESPSSAVRSRPESSVRVAARASESPRGHAAGQIQNSVLA